MRKAFLLAATALLATSTAAHAAPACTAGAWTVVDSANMPPVRYQTEHFAFRWKGDDAQLAQVTEAGKHLEMVWRLYRDTIGFREPDCAAATKRKVNVHLDPTFGLTGGLDGANLPAMWINPPALADHWGLAHEFAHALQGSSGGLRDSPYVGWMWESHANWMAHQLPEYRGNVHCSEMLANYPHLYYGSTRDRYCNWQFFEYLKDRYGYAAVNNIYLNAPKQGDPTEPTADPFKVLMANQGWSLEQLNDVFGAWALHNADWDYTDPDGTDQGAVYRRAYGPNDPYQGDDRLLRVTMLDAIDLAKRRFAVPAAWAPQRWGYNMVRLYPDRGATSVSVDFRGVVQTKAATAKLPGLKDEPATVPQPASGWRWGLVAVGANGRSRYSPLQRGAEGAASLALQPGDTALYMVVVGAPTRFEDIRWDQPYYSIYRYPWMAQFTGAMPAGFEGAAMPGGHRHSNGGGWVADGATVDATAYVGPTARVLAGRVLGRARIEDLAVVDGGTVQDDAVAAGLTIVKRGTVLRDHARAASVFMGLGAFEPGVDLSGDAQVIGDVEERGVPLSAGVRYGFVDAETAKAAAPATPVAEVTAAPEYVWRE
ncbi:Svx/AvrXca family virulence/avirulence protein [soil metagenome]